MIKARTACLVAAVSILCFLTIDAYGLGYGSGYNGNQGHGGGFKTGSGCTIFGVYTKQMQIEQQDTDLRRCNLKDDTAPTIGRVIYMSTKICVEVIDSNQVANVEGFNRWNYTNYWCHNPIVDEIIAVDFAGNVAELRI